MYLRRFLFTLFAVAFAFPAFGQSTAKTFTLKAANACAPVSVSTYASVGIQVTGTFSATLQPEVSIGGQSPQNTQVTPTTSSTAQATITTAGTYVAAVGGMDTFLLCVSSYVSGSAVVWLNPSDKVNASTLGGSSFPVISPQVVSSGGSITPTGTGQIASTNAWDPLAAGAIYPFVPTFTINNTGGSLTQNVVYVRLTYVGPSVIVPSAELKAQLTTTSCASNSTCQIVVNMPTSCQAGSLPAGVTGCTVWDTAAGVNQELQQAAANACVNITAATCTINTLAAGSAIASPPAGTGVVPSSLTAIAQPDFIVPTTYIQLGDGTYAPAGGIDYSCLNFICGQEPVGGVAPAIGSTPGTFTWTHRFFFNDTNAAPIQANDFISIHHLAGQTTAQELLGANTLGVDDRAFGVEMVDAGANFTGNQIGQSLSQYNERILANPAFTCIGGTFPNSEVCAGAGRFVVGDIRTSPTGTQGGPTVALSGSNQSGNGAGTIICPSASVFSDPPCVVGVAGGASVTANATFPASSEVIGGWFGTNASAGQNGYGFSVWADAQPSNRFGKGNFGLYSADFGTDPRDFGLLLFTQTANSNKAAFMGPVYEFQPEIGTTVPSQLGNAGALGIFQFTPTTGGSTTWQYQIVPKDLAGGWSPATTGTTFKTTTGAATLNGSTFNQIVVPCSGLGADTTGSPCVIGNGATLYGVVAYDVYRTTAGGTPNTTGYIATFTCAYFSACTFIDTGLAVIAGANNDPTPPAYNTSGAIAGYTYRTITNCAAVGSAASPSVAACGAAPAGTVSCATNATATCTVNTSAVTASSQIFISQREDTTTGTRLGVTCNVTPSVIIADENITAVVAGTSFSFSLTQPVTNPDCFSYFIVN